MVGVVGGVVEGGDEGVEEKYRSGIVEHVRQRVNLIAAYMGERIE